MLLTAGYVAYTTVSHAAQLKLRRERPAGQPAIPTGDGPIVTEIGGDERAFSSRNHMRKPWDRSQNARLAIRLRSFACRQ